MLADKRGFALPTILIASIVMMVVLAATVATLTSIRAALERQYYDKLAYEAAESGVRFAEACLRNNNMIPQWTNTQPLKPNTDCTGVSVSGRSAYVLSDTNVQTAYTITLETTAGVTNELRASGVAEQLRTSNGAVWRSAQSTIKAEISGEPLEASSVTSGRYQVCAILSEKTWCNGGNNFGQMGNGRTDPLPPATSPPTGSQKLYLVPEPVVRQSGALLGKRDKITASGQEATCTVTTDNEIYCWGRTDYNQLGSTGPTTHPGVVAYARRVAKPAAMTGEVTKIVMGYYTMCAISGGELWCWGRNDEGQLGIGTTSPISFATPQRVAVIGASRGLPVTDVTLHPFSLAACAVAGAKVYCWGNNTYGQVGNGSTARELTPKAVVENPGVMQGKTMTKVVIARAVRMADGAIDYPDARVAPCEGYTDRQCYTQAHTCALSSDGQMFCWGANRYGQMGRGTWDTTTYSSPVRILGALNGKTIRDIAVSYRTSCALTTEPDSGNRLYCWGGNTSGAGGLGHEDACSNTTAALRSICSPSPVVMQTPGLQNKYISSISAGVNRMCAIADKVSYCTGLNTHAQIGDGTRITRFVPTEARLFRQFRPLLLY